MNKEIIAMSYNWKTARANEKYKKEHIKRVPLDMQNEEYAKLKAYCVERGLPVNTFIKACLRKEMGTTGQEG